jgi:large subunit ribosomal protein L3
VGQQLTADVLVAGERVDAIAVSKGKGFAGAMKRHNFKGQGAAHGNHKKHRSPGSIGACATPARVFRGTKMAGRMGGHQVTSLNLEVVQADPDKELDPREGGGPRSPGRHGRAARHRQGSERERVMSAVERTGPAAVDHAP